MWKLAPTARQTARRPAAPDPRGRATRAAALGAALAATLLLAACGDDETGPSAERFRAVLTGQAERPNPVTTNAAGEATFTVRGTTVEFQITVTNLVNGTLAHIHGPATADQTAGVIVTLFSSPQSPVNITSGTLAQGSFGPGDPRIASGITLDSVLVLMRNGRAYVNVHTVARPGGEIRGQITRG